MKSIDITGAVQIVLAAFTVLLDQLRGEQAEELALLQVAACYPDCTFVPVYKSREGHYFRQWTSDFVTSLPKALAGVSADGRGIYQSVHDASLIHFGMPAEGEWEIVENSEEPKCWVRTKRSTNFLKLRAKLLDRARHMADIDLAMTAAYPFINGWLGRGEFSGEKENCAFAFPFVETRLWSYSMLNPIHEALARLVEESRATEKSAVKD